MSRAITYISFFVALVIGFQAFAQQGSHDAVSPPPGTAEQAGQESTVAGDHDATQTETAEQKAAGQENAEEKKVVEMKDIHDIKPPVDIGIDPKPYYYVIGTILILAAIAGLIVWLLKRKRKTNERAFIPLPPDEIALNLLDELIEVEKFDGKDFYFRLSAILRGYIGGRYGFNAPEMTTEELVPMIDKLDADRKLLKALKDLMVSSDPIKFAGLYTVENKMKGDLTFVRNFVNETRNSEQTTDNRQPSTVNRQPSTVNRQPTTDNRQPTTDNRQPITDNR